MYKIRQFHPNDMFTIIRLASDTLTEQYNPSIFNFFYESFPKGFWVAEYNHKIIGFIVGLKIGDNTAKILMLSVIKNVRRKKIGTNLLKYLINELKKEKISYVELEVSKKNLEAISFYQKQGFKIKEILEKFYQNNQDAYLMQKKI